MNVRSVISLGSGGSACRTEERDGRNIWRTVRIRRERGSEERPILFALMVCFGVIDGVPYSTLSTSK